MLSFSEPVCSALQSVFTGLHGAHDGKPRTWCVVGVPQALAVFIVYMIVFSKPRRVGVHFLPRQCACPKGGPGWFPGTRGIVVVQQPSWLLGQPQASVLSYVWLFLFFLITKLQMVRRVLEQWLECLPMWGLSRACAVVKRCHCIKTNN